MGINMITSLWLNPMRNHSQNCSRCSSVFENLSLVDFVTVGTDIN